MRLWVDFERLGGIPVMRMAPEQAERLPVVFLVHGFTGQKEHNLELGASLARAGFLVIAPDAPHHGERDDGLLRRAFEPGQGQVYPLETGLDFYLRMLEMVEMTCVEIGQMIDRLADDPRADSRRVGISGLSFGGLVTFYAAAHEPRIQAAVASIATPGFAQRWRDATLEAASYAHWSDAMTAALPETERRAAWLERVDPLTGLARYTPKPLLVQCGDLDTDMPKFYAVQAMRAWQPLYAAHPERLKLTIYDHVAHQVSSEMRADALAWFQKYL